VGLPRLFDVAHDDNWEIVLEGNWVLGILMHSECRVARTCGANANDGGGGSEERLSIIRSPQVLFGPPNTEQSDMAICGVLCYERTLDAWPAEARKRLIM
jgi:hypothetical protein